jgi:ribonuclease D
MALITDSTALAAFCERQRQADFLAVDTEFMREKTYFPQLCLVQIAGPDEAVAIDTLAPDIELKPLLDLMLDPGILKVFHAARQDIEIFVNLTGLVPAPLFDTQVAAMVCGYGESASYETLASKLAGARLDKSSRFTDWSQRPLTQRQLDYALADVVHLRTVYAKLRQRLDRTGRAEWLSEEIGDLTDPTTYRSDPGEAWRRFRVRNGKPRFLGVLRELAAWREIAAQTRNIPRSRILRDESVLEIAAHAPRSIDALSRTRGLGKGVAEGRLGGDILAAVERGLGLPESELPTLPQRTEALPGIGPLVDLLRVLLKLRAEEHEVAQKLVASADDLEAIATDDQARVKALTGWRWEVFGRDAIALKHGRIALTASGKRISLVRLPAPAAADSPA